MSKFKYEIDFPNSKTPEELKVQVDKKFFPEIIRYNESTYVIRSAELRNLGLDYHDEIALMCHESGLENAGIFQRSCILCTNATTNLEDLADMSKEGDVISVKSDSKVNCTYKSKEDIEVATPFYFNKHKKKQYYAIRKDCVFDECLVKYLADNGLLEEYKFDVDFDFKQFLEFKSLRDVSKRHYLKNVRKKLPKEFWEKSLWKRIGKFFRRNF
ncbi:hypothetical protein GOV12_06955 [Candidatus Pacearchaeota archaeon]|nr:hypothetical protein [Candidatus Pacearchaeota archaeon]